MAEGPPAASKETKRETEHRPDRDKVIKRVFSSALWYYTVHKYIGDIVQDNRLNIDYRPEHKWICFQWYCDTVSQFMEYIAATKRIAVVVLKAMPTRMNLAKDVMSDPDALIAEKDAIYILATYNFKCFGYLLSSLAIGLKESCLDFVEKQLRELAEKTPSETLSEQIKEFTRKQKTSIVDQQKKTFEGIEKLLGKDYLNALKRTSPLSFVTSKEIDFEAMPPVPKYSGLWEGHFLRVCNIRLSLALTKEKEEFEADFSEPRGRLRPKILDQFKRLKNILSNPGVPPMKNPYPFTGTTRKFRLDISELIGEKLH